MSNRVMFPQATSTKALASLVDLMPTLASLAKVPNPKAWIFRGADLTPVIADAVAHPSAPSARVQDSVMFTFDDQNAANRTDRTRQEPKPHPHGARRRRWKYSVYFDPDGRCRPSAAGTTCARPVRTVQFGPIPAPASDFDPGQMAVMEAKLYARIREPRPPARRILR